MTPKVSYADKGDVLFEELVQNIENEDLVKAEVVLEHLGEVEAGWRKKMVEKLEAADPDWVLKLLVKHFRKSPEHRSHFDEYGELVWFLVGNYPEILQKHVNESFLPFIREALRQQTDKKVIQHSLELAMWTHDEELVPLVADYLHSGTRNYVLGAIKALGAMGVERGYEALKDRMGTDRSLDKAIIDAIAENPQPMGLKLAVETMASPEAVIRNYAKNMLTRLGKSSVDALCQGLKTNDQDLVIHILNVLGMIGDFHAVDAIRELLLRGAENANIRFAAYEALGNIPLRTKAYALAVGLTDEDEQVRYAAARAINSNLSPRLERGLFNMVKPHNQSVENLIIVFLNAEADRIFLTLLKDDYFKEKSEEYLRDRAHPELRDHYVELLRRYGELDMAKRLSQDGGEEEKIKSDIWAIDDSRMVLKIYRKHLHHLGRETELFEFPSRALEKLEIESPRMIFVDLNMPEMNGLEFCKSLRKTHSKEEVPVVLVTTQTDDNQDQQAIEDAGICEVLPKPFNADVLKGAMERWLK